MSEEIKLVDAPVEKALAELKSSIQAFETSFSKGEKGDNSLEMVEKVNEIKQTFEEIAKSYQELLLNNSEATKQATAQLKETEASMASAFHLLK